MIAGTIRTRILQGVEPFPLLCRLTCVTTRPLSGQYGYARVEVQLLLGNDPPAACSAARHQPVHNCCQIRCSR